jgi:hypothetical protein
MNSVQARPRPCGRGTFIETGRYAPIAATATRGRIAGVASPHP